ncbi:MAG: DUF5722 domain-containing protein [Acidimicrobiales bacterium]
MRGDRGRLRVVATVVVVVLAGLGPLTAGADGVPRGGADRAAVATAGALADPSTYPRDPVGGIKGLQPDLVPDKDALAPGLGTVAVNFAWWEWEPTRTPAPCAPDQVEADGRCYVVPPVIDAEVRAWFDRGVPVTGIFYGTPPWARGARPCSPANPGFEVFCVPDDPVDFARFVGMIARRYDGARGAGRVTDFVVQNEVDMNDWFDVGCGQGVPCDPATWISTYASIYNPTYDVVRAAQPSARVLISFTHHFDPVFDAPAATNPTLSVKTFLTALVPLLGDRQWSIAAHPYPRLPAPVFDARDLPFATLGSIGALVGWLRATFPANPLAGEVQLTEVGLNAPPAYEQLQAEALCTAFRNVTGTPGVTSFIYHRLLDQKDEFGLALGLRRIDGSAKPAFAVWHDVNLPGSARCGFDLLPHTVVQHGLDPVTGAHWYSSRELPSGVVATGEQWLLSHEVVPGTAMLYECGRGESSHLSRAVTCEGDVPLGPVGAIGTAAAPGRTALYRCSAAATELVTIDPACEGDQVVLGYVDGEAPPTTTAAVVSPATPVASGAVTPAFTG